MTAFEFRPIHPSALFLGPAAKVYRGMSRTFEINGLLVTLVTPNAEGLKAVCKQFGLLTDTRQPDDIVAVASRFVINEVEDDGLGLDTDDGLGDGL